MTIESLLNDVIRQIVQKSSVFFFFFNFVALFISFVFHSCLSAVVSVLPPPFSLLHPSPPPTLVPTPL